MYKFGTTPGELNALSPATIGTGSSYSTSMATLSITINNIIYKYLYVVNGIISMYNINNNSGQLSPLSPASISTGTNYPLFITTETIGGNNYAYTCGFGNNVAMFSINSSGVLSALSPATIACGNSPGFIATISFGSTGYAYVCNFDTNISMYSINSLGKLTALSPAKINTVPGEYPCSMSIIKIGANTYAYVATTNYGLSLKMYSINNSTGQLTALSPAGFLVDRTYAVVTVNIGSNYYLYTTTLSRIYMFSINGSSGQLTALNPVFINVNPALLYDLSIKTINDTIYIYGRGIYSPNQTPQYLFIYKINKNDGTLIFLSRPTVYGELIISNATATNTHAVLII